MTKSQLIEALATAEGITVKAAEIAVDVAIDSIASALVHGNRIEIRGLGSFKVKNYDGYDGRNPKSGEKIEVKPKKLPFFKVGKELKDRLNGGDYADPPG
jgi:integration host factor subunit beta